MQSLYISRENDILQFMRWIAEKTDAGRFAQSVATAIRRNGTIAVGVVAVSTLVTAVPATADSSGAPPTTGATNSTNIIGNEETAKPSADKTQYNLFNPTPSALMRDLSADRPDKTDCPETVDAGHFQIEMDFANLTYDQPNSQRGNVTSTAYQAAPVSLKAGLLNNADVELVFNAGF